MVPLPVDKDLLQQLIEMGFSDVRARKGIHHGIHLDGAIVWLSEHQDDPGDHITYQYSQFQWSVDDSVFFTPSTSKQILISRIWLERKILYQRFH